MRAELVELLLPSVCPGCDRPRASGDPLLCASCERGLRPLERLGAVRTAVAYEGSGALLVQRFKFEGRRDALRVLAALLAPRLADLRGCGLVPVPRHLARVRALGLDPAHDLARALGRATGLPVWGRVLRRSRPVLPQTGLTNAERRANVCQSFRTRAGALEGRRAVLVDDVVTTGATLAEAAKTLRRDAGARRIVAVALAGTVFSS